MGLVSKPTGVVSQRNNNKYIWTGEVAPGAPLEYMKITITSPFVFSSIVYPIEDTVEFDFKDVIERALTNEVNIGTFPYFRLIREVKQLNYVIEFNGDLDLPSETLSYVNAAYQFAYSDVFQTNDPVFLVDKIYAWNSFPVYVPIFVPFDGIDFQDSFNGDTSPDFTLTEDNSIYIRVLTNLLNQGIYSYSLRAEGLFYRKDVHYLDRCGYKGVNLLDFSEGFNNPYWAKVNCTATDNAYIAPNGKMEASLITVTNPGAFIYRLSVGADNQTKSIFAKTVSGTGAVALLGNRDYARNNVTVTEQWQRFDLPTDITEVTFEIYYAIDFRASSLTSLVIWRANLTETPNLLNPIQSPIPFIPIDRSKDFYLRWINTDGDSWEFWLFDEHFEEEQESESRGVIKRDVYSSLGKDNDIVKILAASNLQPDMYDKVKRILYASKVELLIDNSITAPVYQEVFITGDLVSNTRKPKNYIQIKMSEQPFKNN